MQWYLINNKGVTKLQEMQKNDNNYGNLKYVQLIKNAKQHFRK